MIQRFTSPEVPSSLLLYDTLLPRMNLPYDEKQKREQLFKGFIGEMLLKKKLPSGNSEKVISLFNLLLEAKGAEFQIDSLLICSDTIYLLEVKNYTGDYYVHHDKIFSMRTKEEIYDPFLQLERSTYFFKSLLSSLKISIDVQPYVVFINDQFTLYQAPTHFSMILPTQVKRFFQKLYANATPVSSQHSEIANLICNQNKSQSDNERLPLYDYNNLKKGLFCPECMIELIRKNHLYVICPNCQTELTVEEIVLRSIAEFHLLFPGEEITPSTIEKWCGKFVSSQGISKILRKHFDHSNRGKNSNYSFPKNNSHLHVLKRGKYDEVLQGL